MNYFNFNLVFFFVVLINVGIVQAGSKKSGCVPSSRQGTSYAPVCLALTKATSGIFNKNLRSLVDTLNKQLAGPKFAYINSYGIVVSDPATNGFRFTSTPCCMVSATTMCAPNSPICSDRSQYAYFDGVHPTEAVAAIEAKRAFAPQSPSDAYPYDIKHLALA